jgi:hypothetical protein
MVRNEKRVRFIATPKAWSYLLVSCESRHRKLPVGGLTAAIKLLPVAALQLRSEMECDSWFWNKIQLYRNKQAVIDFWNCAFSHFRSNETLWVYKIVPCKIKPSGFGTICKEQLLLDHLFFLRKNMNCVDYFFTVGFRRSAYNMSSGCWKSKTFMFF